MTSLEHSEADRMADIRERIAEFSQEMEGKLSSADYSMHIKSFGNVPINDTFGEFAEEAQKAKDDCLYRLARMKLAAIERESKHKNS